MTTLQMFLEYFEKHVFYFLFFYFIFMELIFLNMLNENKPNRSDIKLERTVAIFEQFSFEAMNLDYWLNCLE